MEYNIENIKDIVAIAKPLIDPIISTIIQPKLKQLSVWLKGREMSGKLDTQVLESKFEEYLARAYSYCRNVNVLIFQNQQVKITDIYYPLIIQSSKDNNEIRVDDFKLRDIKKYHKVLISDTAGMGKSTLTKWIGMKVIEGNQGIPILIELRNLKSNYTILDEIFNQINPIDKTFDKDLILKMLELGHFVILLDGFDEIQYKNQEVIIKDIRDFINKTSNNYIIMTSRPEGALAAFGDFQLFNILPLEKEDTFNLIRKYDSICPIKVSDALIKDIEKNFSQISELLKNPFLVSLVYITYTYNKDIPPKKIIYYDEIYSALFKRHDLSKDGWTRQKKSFLDIQQFRIILRQLAFDTAIAGSIVYSEAEILDFIAIAKQKNPGIEFSNSDFLDDILAAVPIFLKDGLMIKWAHKSLQDYFAAEFIAFNGRKEDILTRVYKSSRRNFLNILDLYYEIDYKVFRKTIIRKLLEDFIEYCDSCYIDYGHMPKREVGMRKTLTF